VVFAGTRQSKFPKVRPPGYFSPDADPAAVKAFYEANGYLVLESGFTPAEVEELKRETRPFAAATATICPITRRPRRPRPMTRC